MQWVCNLLIYEEEISRLKNLQWLLWQQVLSWQEVQALFQQQKYIQIYTVLIVVKLYQPLGNKMTFAQEDLCQLQWWSVDIRFIWKMLMKQKTGQVLTYVTNERKRHFLSVIFFIDVGLNLSLIKTKW